MKQAPFKHAKHCPRTSEVWQKVYTGSIVTYYSCVTNHFHHRACSQTPPLFAWYTILATDVCPGLKSGEACLIKTEFTGNIQLPTEGSILED